MFLYFASISVHTTEGALISQLIKLSVVTNYSDVEMTV